MAQYFTRESVGGQETMEGFRFIDIGTGLTDGPVADVTVPEDTGTPGVRAHRTLRGEHMDIDFDDFESPRAEMFGDTKSPSFTVNGKTVTTNTVCVRELDDVEYVEFAISHTRQMLLLVPCTEYTVGGYKWAREKGGKRYPTTRTGLPFVMSICRMMGWDPEQRHKIPGKLINSGGIEMMSFDMTAARHFDKKTGLKGSSSQVIFSGDWDGHFGPKFSAGRRSFQLSTFDDLTVWSIKEGDTEQAYMLPVNSGAGETAETVVSDVSGDAATNTGVETYE